MLHLQEDEEESGLANPEPEESFIQTKEFRVSKRLYSDQRV
jgi:hypothetical protein